MQPSTTLSWEQSDGEELGGYKVYWRETTAPQWQNSRFVGKVHSYVLENTVIDNFLFGVVAVGKDGNESVVVFPFRTFKKITVYRYLTIGNNCVIESEAYAIGAVIQ